MNSELFVIFAAIAIALLMAVKPEMFILNAEKRTPQFVRAIKYIGMSVAIVLLTWFLADRLL